MRSEVVTSRLQPTCGDEDTPVDFEKGMLLLLRSEWNGEVSVTDTAQHIQQLWDCCEASQEANQ